MPHFISIVVVCGLLAEFCESDGLLNDLRAFLGMERTSLLAQTKYFRTIFVGSDIWQHVGWRTIIYLVTLSGVDQSLHEAAAIDGAGRMRRILHVNLPAIMPVIVIQLIMRVGRMMLVGFYFGRTGIPQNAIRPCSTTPIYLQGTLMHMTGMKRDISPGTSPVRVKWIPCFPWVRLVLYRAIVAAHNFGIADGYSVLSTPYQRLTED